MPDRSPFGPTRLERRALCVARIAAGALLFMQAVVHADPVPISPAETLLFMTRHLQDVQPPRRLHYAFRKSGTLEQGFSDTVDVDITGGSDGSMKSTTRFFSGARRMDFPEIEHVEGNPVLLFYLDREVREMSRLTHGTPIHFQKMMRTALAESAQIRNIDIRFDGRSLPARQITITPYVADPHRERFEQLAAKKYVFTLCEAIPGRVYQLRAVVPAASGSSKDEAVIDETLTFQSADAPK
jgi:hypothetical protein